MSDTQVRATLSCRLLADDARWAASSMELASSWTVGGDMALLTMAHHVVRIVFEGEILLGTPALGLQELADCLPPAADPITEKIRNSSKLLDDAQSAPDLVVRLGRARAQAYQAFVGVHSSWLVRRMCRDLGLYRSGGRLVSATIPMSLRLGLPPVTAPGFGAAINELVGVARGRWGPELALMAQCDGGTLTEAGAVRTPEPTIVEDDQRTRGYLRSRFGEALSTDEKLLVLLIETELNANLEFLPLAAPTEVVPVRMAMVTLYHSLRSLWQLVHQHPNDASAAPIRRLLDSVSAMEVLGDSGRKIRNHCVHYGIGVPRSDLDRLDPELPMCGLVEAIDPGMTWAGFSSNVLTNTQRLSDTLAAWTS